MGSAMNYLEHLRQNEKTFITFLSEKYPFFFNSNIFLRDIQYGISAYFKLKEKKLGFTEAENIARVFVNHLESLNKLKKVSHNTWIVLIPNEKTASDENEKITIEKENKD